MNEPAILTRSTIAHIIRTLLIATLLSLSNASSTESNPITYTINSASLGGASLGIETPPDFLVEGTITTDGTIGALSASDIASWSWSATNGTVAYQATSAAGSVDNLVGLVATSSELFLPGTPSVQGAVDLRSNAEPWSLQFMVVQGEGVIQLFQDLPTNDGFNSATALSENSFLIATVPEPATISLAWFAAAGLAAWRWRRAAPR